MNLGIAPKANRVLHFVLIAMFLILVRVWHLTIIQYDKKLEESQKPQRKTVIEPAIRATIRDRFNLPFAINKISYQATILYSQIREIPSIEWQLDASGKKVKIFKRKAYIRKLSEELASQLNLSADRIEDLIYAKASYYSLVPFAIKDDLSEEEYYRLKILEKDWPGLHIRHLPKRFYPKGAVGADVIGYMGSINRNEYEKILHEIKALEEFIQESEKGGQTEPLTAFESSQQARKRLQDLEAKAYTIHDYIGKTGIEGEYEQLLRGSTGKKQFTTDSKGNFLRALPGSRPTLPGHRILLTLSSELQEYAEQLLAQNEEVRIVRKSSLGAVKKTVEAQKQPWIKGGAIIAMDPASGEIIALASHPRFNPNDFISSGINEEKKEKLSRINRWFENETHIAEMWNQQIPLARERYDSEQKLFYDDTVILTWNTYLDFILAAKSPLRLATDQIKTISQSINLQKKTEELSSLFPAYDLYALFNELYNGGEHQPFRQRLNAAERQKISALMAASEEAKIIKSELDPFFQTIPLNYDKVLLVDLCRLAVADDRFSPDLIREMGETSLENHHRYSGFLSTLLAITKESAKKLFHQIDFKAWRLKEEKEFLKQKRLDEKNAKAYPKPYIDYFDQQEQEYFKDFWQAHRWDLLYTFLTGNVPLLSHQSPFIQDFQPYVRHFQLWNQEINRESEETIKWKRKHGELQKLAKGLTQEMAIAYFKTLRSYENLDRPLKGFYRYLRKDGDAQLEKHLAAAFYPTYGFGYGRSYAYRQSSTQGSLFKLVTAYEALVQRFQKLERKVISPQDLNPLVIDDQVFTQGNVSFVGYNEEGKPIPQLYKGGRLPRSLAHRHTGRVDLLKAIEFSSNPYFSLLAGECLEQPEDLSKAARLFSYGKRTGIDLPGEITGYVPQDLASNRTGLYAMAIGQHSLVVTPLQTAVMLAAIINGGKVIKPKVVKMTAGREAPMGDDPLVCLPHFPYQKSLSHVGIDFPLFSALSSTGQESLVKVVPTVVQREIFMPEVIRQILLKGLWMVTQRTYQENISNLARLYRQSPDAIRHFTELKKELLGKTSTSESVENIDLDLQEGTNIYTHVWFGSASFESNAKDKSKAAMLYKDEFGQPELIVIVYLRYGGYGKEAAPLAAQIVKKWREIKQKHQDRESE